MKSETQWSLIKLFDMQMYIREWMESDVGEVFMSCFKLWTKPLVWRELGKLWNKQCSQQVGCEYRVPIDHESESQTLQLWWEDEW